MISKNTPVIVNSVGYRAVYYAVFVVEFVLAFQQEKYSDTCIVF